MTKEAMDPASNFAIKGAGFLEDEDIQEEVKKLMLQSLRHANHMMRTGSPDVKAGIMRTMLPAVARTIKSQQESDELEEMRKAMQAMMAQVATAIPQATK